MAKDLAALSHKDLLKLKQDVEKALRDSETRARKEARKAAEKAAAEFGFSLDDVASNGTPRKKPVSPPKYRNPDNHDETWSGRGRKPRWLNEAIAAGTDISALEI